MADPLCCTPVHTGRDQLVEEVRDWPVEAACCCSGKRHCFFPQVGAVRDQLEYLPPQPLRFIHSIFFTMVETGCGAVGLAEIGFLGCQKHIFKILNFKRRLLLGFKGMRRARFLNFQGPARFFPGAEGSESFQSSGAHPAASPVHQSIPAREGKCGEKLAARRALNRTATDNEVQCISAAHQLGTGALRSPMRSPRRLSRRGDDEWSYATDGTGQVLWYCPPGSGAEKYRNRVGLKKYWETRHRGTPYPKHFSFRAADALPNWRRVEHREEDEGGEDEGQENGGRAGSDGGGRGRGARGHGAEGNGSPAGEVRRRSWCPETLLLQVLCVPMYSVQPTRQ